MSKESGTYSRLFLEMFSILLAVFLAFTLENWREEEKNEKLANSAFSDILNEFKENVEMINKKDSALQVFIDNCEQSIESENGQYDLNYSMHTYYLNSWETAQLSQAIQHMHYEKVKDTQRSYLLLNFAKKLSANIVTIVTSPDFHDDARSTASRKALLLNATSLQSTNNSIINALEKLIKKYEQKSN